MKVCSSTAVTCPHTSSTKPETGAVELENPFILLADKESLNIREMLPVLEAVAKQASRWFIIAEDVEGEALATGWLTPYARGIVKVAAVKARLRRPS